MQIAKISNRLGRGCLASDFISLCLLLLVTVFASEELHAQRYSNSIASTEFDIITTGDPSCFEKLEHLGQRSEEMPDKTGEAGDLFQQAFVFLATFRDGTSVEMAIDADFGTLEIAQDEAKRYTDPLGRLPTLLRSDVKRLVVHKGGETTTAFSDVGLIVLYSGNASKRINDNDLEETLFHESVHASLDKEYAKSERWKRAQVADIGFATVYGKSKPELEDLAESALLAFAVIHHPDRLPREEIQYLREQIPNRILFIESLMPFGKPLTYTLRHE